MPQDETQMGAETEAADQEESSPSEEQVKETEARAETKPEGEGGEKSGERDEEPQKEKADSEAEKQEEKAEETLPPVPYKRFAKAIADKNEALDRIEALEEEKAQLEEYVMKTKDVIDFAKRLVAARNFDPRIRELFQEHWLFTGREPQETDIDNVRAYGEYLAEIRSQDETQEAPEETDNDAAEEAIMKTWISEEEKLAADPELKPIVTKERLIETYREIAERGRKGEDVSKLSFAKVFRDLWFDDIIEAKKEAARKEASSKVSKKKPASMKPGQASQPKPRDLSKLPLHEHIAAVVRGETAA